MIAQWRESQEGKARLISAHFDAEVHRVETESNAHSLQIIAEAQAQARQSIDTTIESGRGVVEITREDITQLIEFQGRKRLANTRSVVEDAADELGDKEVSNHEPDHDWTARFFNDIQDVSSEEMQSLWAKVLAGEVEKPGSTSIQTLSILKILTKRQLDFLGSSAPSVYRSGWMGISSVMLEFLHWVVMRLTMPWKSTDSVLATSMCSTSMDS